MCTTLMLWTSGIADGLQFASYSDIFNCFRTGRTRDFRPISGHASEKPTGKEEG